MSRRPHYVSRLQHASIGVAVTPTRIVLLLILLASLQHCCGLVAAAAAVVSDDASILLSISAALGLDFWDFPPPPSGRSGTTMAEVCASPRQVKCGGAGTFVAEIWLVGPRSNTLRPLTTVDAGLEGVPLAAFARLSELQGLRALYLNSVGLTGPLPEQWGDEMNGSLVILNLSQNKLTGTIPKTFENINSLLELWLDSNDLSGGIPPLCSRPGVACDFTGNPSMCEAGQRSYIMSCVPCEPCVHGGGCSGGFDTYLCSSCMPGYYLSSGLCVSCSKGISSSLVAFLSITLGAGFAMMAFFVRQKILKKKVRLPSLRLGVNNQVIIKQVGSMLQLTSLLGNLSFSLPTWFKIATNMLSAFALPISFNTPCVSGLESLARWQQGLMLAFFLTAGVLFLVHARRICRWALPSSAFSAMTPGLFVTLQTLAGVIVTQSAVLLLPLSFNINERKGDAIDCWIKTGQVCVNTVIEGLISFAVAIGLAATVTLVIQRASVEYGAKRAEIEASGDAAESTKYEDGYSLLSFWGSFCTPYVPQSAHHESNAIRRKILTFFVSNISVFSVLVSQTARANAPIRLGPISLPPPIQGKVQLPIVPSISASVDALSFILVQLMYLRHVLRRPYVSDPVSSSSYDTLNEADLMGVRALCWGAFVFAVKEIISTGISLRASEMTGNVLCVIVLLALLMSQRPLFYGFAKGAGGRVSIAAAATRRGLNPLSIARGSDLDKSEGLSASDAGEKVSSKLEKRHSDGSIQEQIQAIRDSDSPSETLKLQIRITTMLHLLPLMERQRWTYKEAAVADAKQNGRFTKMLRRALTILAAVLASFLVAISVTLLVWYSCTKTFMPWVFLAVLCLVMLLMEWLIWRAKQDYKRCGTAGASSVIKSFSFKSQVDEKSPIDSIELVDNPMVDGKTVEKKGGNV